ncbi:hypothetical protein MRX96_042032 [Rhipicephalus microplus]
MAAQKFYQCMQHANLIMPPTWTSVRPARSPRTVVPSERGKVRVRHTEEGCHEPSDGHLGASPQEVCLPARVVVHTLESVSAPLLVPAESAVDRILANHLATIHHPA